MGSPGMRVVVYFPPNLVGLNISDCTVAIAKSTVSHCSNGGLRRPYSLLLGALRAIDVIFWNLAAIAITVIVG